MIKTIIAKNKETLDKIFDKAAYLLDRYSDEHLYEDKKAYVTTLKNSIKSFKGWKTSKVKNVILTPNNLSFKFSIPNIPNLFCHATVAGDTVSYSFKVEL